MEFSFLDFSVSRCLSGLLLPFFSGLINHTFLHLQFVPQSGSKNQQLKIT